MADDLLHARTLLALDANPDQAAAEQARAERLGVSPAAAADNPEIEQAEVARVTSLKLDQAPASSRWFMRNAEIAHDDVDNLTAGERTLNTFKATVLNTRQIGATVKNFLGLEMTEVEAIERRGRAEEARRLSKAGLAEWEAPGIRQADPEAWLALEFAQDVTRLGAQAVESLPFMGAVAAGTLAGGPAGGFATAALLSSAEIHETLSEEYKLPGPVSRAVATVGGSVSGALDYLGTSQVLGAVLPKQAAKREIAKILGRAAVQPGFVAAAGRVARGAAVEGYTEGGQSIIEDLAVAIRQTIAGEAPDQRVTVDGEEYTGLAAVLMKAIEAAKVGFVSGGAGVPAELAGSFRESKAQQAKIEQGEMDALLRVADGSKIRERAPAKYVEALKEQIVETGAPAVVYVPAPRLLELYQAASANAKAELAAAAPGVVERLREAQATGADVAVPTELWVGTLAHTEIGKGLRKAWRTDPHAMTAEEAEAEAPALEAEARRLVEAENAPDPYGVYQREVEDMLVSTGLPVEQARRSATIARSQLETQATERGLSFRDALARFGLPQISSAREVRAEAQREAQQRAEKAGEFDRDVMAALIAEARMTEPTAEPVDEADAMRRSVREEIRGRVQALGLDVATSPTEEILDALEAQAGEEFVAAQDEIALFQRSAVEGIGPAKWLRRLELQGNKLLARNILETFEKAPPTREITAAALAGVAKKGWYRRSMVALSHVFGEDAPRFAALLAALSPQDSVQNNLKNALKVWLAWVNEGRPTDEDAIVRILNEQTTVESDKDAIADDATETEALHARVPNSIRALTATPAALADKSFQLSGQKVDSFWRNLTGDMEAVTLDSWMATFFGIEKGKLGTKGRYRGYTAAIRKAAAELTKKTGEPWSPAEVQETIWSWAKALVEQRATKDEFRTADQIIKQRGLDPAKITSVPDFAGLLSDAVYAPLVEELGLGERVAEVSRGAAEDAGARAGAEAEAAARVPERAPLERAARRVEAVVAERERAKRAQRELAQRSSVEATVERLRGLGLRVEASEAGELVFVGHDGAKVTIEQLETPEGQKAFHEAVGFPTDPTGRDTIEDLKVYRLKGVFGNTVEEVEAKLRPWLKKIGWKFKRFGPGTGKKGKPFWPNFRDPKTPSYKDRTAWIFSEQVPEGSFFDPPYTLAWRVPHEIAHGLTNPMLDERYGPGFRAGALGKVVRGPFFKEDVARTLTEALRATDWEVETFRAQRAILEQEFGVDLTEEEFRKENAINYAGALYRAITGQFADPNTVGVLPFAPDPERLQEAGRELLRAVAAERGALEAASSEGGEGSMLDDPAVRGVTQFEGSFLEPVRIILKENASAATAIHEMWHVWFAHLQREAEREPAAGWSTAEIRAHAKAKRMWEAALKWAGAAPGARELTEAQREKLARGGEAYVREGRAPSLALREAFDRFSQWMRQIYKTLLNLERDAGQPVRLSDEMRSVFDRMLATDQQIAEAREARGFTAPNEAGIVSLMTPEEREQYEELLATAARKTRERVAQVIHREAKAKARADYEVAAAEIREQVEREVLGRPVVKALVALAAGEGLDPVAVRQLYGKLPRGLPAEVVKDGGLHPDVAAELVGYTDGAALLRELAEIGRDSIEEIVAREARARVKAELGSINQYGRDEIVHALAELPENVDAMRIAERALARRAGAKVVSKDAVRRAAKRIVAETPVVQLAPHKFRAAAEKAGTDAVTAAGKGDWAAALAAKRRQQLNLFLESEATKAREQSEADHDRLAWLEGPTASVTLTKAGHTYRDQIVGLLSRFNLSRTTGAAIEKRQALASWYADQVAAGETPAIPDHIRDEAFTKNWRELTVQELRDITDSANSIYALARRKVAFIAAEKQRDRDAVRADLITKLEGVTKLPPSERYTDPDDPKARSLGKKILALGAALDKIVSIVDHLDGGDTNGPWHTYVYRPIAEALGRKQDMARDYAEKVQASITELVKGREKQYLTKHATGLAYTDDHGRPTLLQVTKLRLIGIALNLGNDSNKKKLLEGYGWTEADVLAELGKHLTEADWKFVQRTWDLIDGLWPEIAAQEEKLNGVTPERVLPRELQVVSSDGKVVSLAGGYFPVVYDPSRATWAYKNASRQLFDGVENHFMRAITGHGHTQARTEVTGPILFDLAIVPRHLDEVIHDLAFRATLLDVDILLDNKEVKAALGNALGKSYENIFRPWLQSIAQDRTFTPKLMAPWEKLLRRIRVNTSSAVLFFRDTTLLMQLSGHAPARAEMRAHFDGDGWKEDYKAALRTAAHNPKRSAEFVRARSAFMRARIDTSDRDRRDQVRELQGRLLPTEKALHEAIALGGALISGTQFYTVDVPVWIAAYNAALRTKKMSEADASFLADQIVRLSQGSGESIDLAEIQRGSEAWKQLTPFYSYISSQWATLRRDVRDWDKGKITFGEFAYRFGLRFTIPACYALAVRGLMPGGEEPPDLEDESWWDEAWFALSASGLLDVAGAIPLLRDMVGSIRYGSVRPTIPAARLAAEAVEVGQELKREELRPVELFTDVVELVGMATGLPVVRAADLVKELNEEKE